ncbi:MAG: hypothetical protein ACP5T3_00245 [Candidatus Micrarchaeia archaeon]
METEDEGTYKENEYGSAIEMLWALDVKPNYDRIKAVIEAANGKYDEELASSAAAWKELLFGVNIVKDAIDILKYTGKDVSIGKIKMVLNVADVRADKELIRLAFEMDKDEIEKSKAESSEELDETLKELGKELQKEIAKTKDTEKREGLELIAKASENVDTKTLTNMLVIKLAYDTGNASLERVVSMLHSLGIDFSKDEIEEAIDSFNSFNKSDALHYSAEILEKLGQKPSVENMLKLVRAAGVEPDEEFADAAATLIKRMPGGSG